MTRGKNRCYVCFRKHEKNRKVYRFPEDMPYKFRWCCNCVTHAGILARTTLEKGIKFYKKYYGRIERISFIRRAKLVNKLIRLS